MLNKSIIRVEQPDIMLDENADEPEVEDQPEQMETDENPPPSPSGGNFPAFPVFWLTSFLFADGASAKLKTRITFEEYNKICYMITHHIRRTEEEADGG